MISSDVSNCVMSSNDRLVANSVKDRFSDMRGIQICLKNIKNLFSERTKFNLFFTCEIRAMESNPTHPPLLGRSEVEYGVGKDVSENINLYVFLEMNETTKGSVGLVALGCPTSLENDYPLLEDNWEYELKIDIWHSRKKRFGSLRKKSSIFLGRSIQQFVLYRDQLHSFLNVPLDRTPTGEVDVQILSFNCGVKKENILILKQDSFFQTLPNTDFAQEAQSELSVHSIPIKPVEKSNRYRILREIGKGGEGTIYMAEDISTINKERRFIALKKVPCRSMNEINYAISSFWPVRKLVHPNLVGIDDLFFDSDVATNYSLFSSPHSCETALSVCYVMELFAEGDLANFFKVNQNTILSEEIVLDYMIQLTSATSYLHKSGLIHCDLKPHNIFLTDRGKTLKIGDFGLVREVDKDYTDKETSGTLRYMAPEIMYDNNQSKRADIWSLGVIMYELMTFRTNENLSVLSLNHPDFERYIETELEKRKYSDEITQLLLSTLRIDPQERITTRQLLLSLQVISCELHQFLSGNLEEVISRSDSHGSLDFSPYLSNLTPQATTPVSRKRTRYTQKFCTLVRGLSSLSNR